MKKLTSVIVISLVFALLLSIGTMAAAKVLYEGKTSASSSLSWTLYDTGELVISGKGTLAAYNSTSEVPWYKHRSKITEITVKSGITGIGKYAFYGLNKVEDVSLPDSLQALGMYSFAYCEALEYIELPDDIEGLPTGLFEGCTSLEEIELPSSLESVRSGVFADCVSLVEITFPGKVDSLGAKVFDGCRSLEEVYFLGDAPATVDKDTFYDVEDISIYYTEDATGFNRLPWRNFDTYEFDGDYDGGSDDDDDGWLDDDDDDDKKDKDDDLWYGDLNEDGKVNSADRKILTYLLSFREDFDPDDYDDRGDIDEDGDLTPMDDILLSRYIDGWKNYELPN
ncbi:MAG: leucine-rich repeat domain-containing protein [Clostridia bacterium]|nr:leucine-rich repeat domain-containing protein [Clostridia bacterium]